MEGITKSIKDIESQIGDKKLTGAKKDQLSEQLDKIGDKIDDLNDNDKLTDSQATSLKDRISRVKNKLDTDDD